MGRAIDTEKAIDVLKIKIKTLETAFDGLASTVDSLKSTAPARRNVDLHKNVKTTTPKEKVKKAELVTEET